MTDSENSAIQDDSDEDIYKDFSDFNFGDELDKIEASKEIYKKEANELSEKVKALNEENQKLKDLNRVLEKNLSTLLKTAQAEVKRKDTTISELREQIESFTFRRSNKLTKDKYTNTENHWNSVINSKVGIKDSRNVRESEKGQSAKGNSLDMDRKSSRYENMNLTEKNSREESPDCDNKTKFSYRHSYSSCRDRSDSIKFCRQDYREHSRNFGRKRKFDRYPCSPRERNFRMRYSRERSNDRQRRRELSRTKSVSRTPEKSKNSKEPSLEKRRNSRSSFEKESKSRNANNAVKCVDTVKKVSKRGETNKIHEREKDKVDNRRISENHSNEKSVPTNEIVTFDRKSPLDALYGEYISSKNCISYLKSASDPSQQHPEVEGEYQDEGYSTVNNTGRDEGSTFKKEGRCVSQAITLFSKRMMKRFSMESKHAESKNAKHEETSREEILKDAAIEKEPGELTDDENEVERSEEFQRVAKAALFENKMMDESLVTAEDVCADGATSVKNKTGKELAGECKNFIEPQTLPPGPELSGSDQNVDDVKEFREVIEFSPFKNNYKLIEISPAKPSDKIHCPDESNRKYIANASSQSSKVESSIFNFLSHLSGIPVNANNLQKKSEKTEKKTNVCDGQMVNEIKSDVPKCEMDDGKSEPEKLVEKDKKLCQPRSASFGKNLKKKSDSLKNKNATIDQKEKKGERISRRSKSHSKEEGKENGDSQKGVAEEKIERVKTDFKDGAKEKNNFESGSEKTEKLTDFLLLDSSPSPSKPDHSQNQEEKSLFETAEEKNKIDSSMEKSRSSEDKNGSKRDESEIQEAGKKISKTSTSSKSRKNVASKAESQKSKATPEKIEETGKKCQESKKKKEKSKEESTKTKKSEESNKTKERPEENVPGRGKRKSSLKIDENQRKPTSKTNETKKSSTDKSRSKRKLSDCDSVESKKPKLDKSERTKKKTMNSSGSSREEEQDSFAEEQKKVKEDISFFEFFKPITKKEETTEKYPKEVGEEASDLSNGFKMATTTTATLTTTLTLTGVMRLETPIKRVEKLKNLTINEQTIHRVSDSKMFGSPFSQLVEMTPRRLLKNDLMLTDSEDDSVTIKPPDREGGEIGGKKAEENSESSLSETSDCESDSGASDLVDLL